MKKSVWTVLLMVALVLPAQAQRDRFSGKGVQVGDRIPQLELYDADGKAVELSNVWKNGPALILTGSLTCPIARRKCPRLEKALRGVEGIRVVMVYTVEAHPSEDPSPYSGKVWTTAANEREGLLVRQPGKLDERLALMKNFIEVTGISFPVVADGLDNKAWKALGSGPNLAVLVDEKGTVVAKQGWLNPKTMQGEVEKLLSR